MQLSLRVSIRVLLCTLLLPCGSRIATLQAQIPEKFENLQVLPKDITRPQLIQIMKGFAIGLGVRCQFCHVGQEGADLSTFDFKSDEKPTKRTARIMLQMVHAVNDTYLSQLDTISGGHMDMDHDHASDRIQVQCVTCHRGQSRPQMMETVIARIVADSGVPAAVTAYRELQRRYYGSYTFDFRERPLNAVAMDLVRQNRNQDALTLLNLNLEKNPDAFVTHGLRGDVFLALGQRDSAIASYRRSLQLRPDDPPVRQKLDSLTR